MRISRRTSGGRGEYEASGETESGLRAFDLIGAVLLLDLGGGWVINSDIQVVNQGGKPRLRRLQKGANYIQIQRQLAAALLLPHPVREDINLAGGLPVLRANKYAIEHIELRNVDLQQGKATLSVSEIVLRNMSHHAEALHFDERVTALRGVWGKSQQLPHGIRDLLEAHHVAVCVGGPITHQIEQFVAMLQTSVTESTEDLGLVYRSAEADVLEDLQRALALTEQPPAQPVAIDQIDPEETQIRRRILKDWKRWANSRGAASATFRQNVREAYHSTCIICGVHLPSTTMNAIPGVDAAHILPWAEYDLDVVSNGVCLCRLHHWAFDEGLIIVREENGTYFVEVPADVAEEIGVHYPLFSLHHLLQWTGPITADRLPAAPHQRPNPQYLRMLAGLE